MFRYIFLLSMAVSLFAEYPTGADYLIICPEAFESRFEDLAQWKTQKGYITRIVTTEETGVSTDDIREYIRNAYSTWEPSPCFVLIGASNYQIPMIYGGSTEYGDFRSDWAYGNLEGDIYNEVHVGRLPARNVSQLDMMIDKILHYEKETAEGDWLSRGITIVYNDYDEDDSLYWANTDTAAAGMEHHGFVHVDRLSLADGHDKDDVVDALEGNGASFIMFRGQATTNWSPPFNVDPEDIDNGYRMPVVASITCHTISDYGSPEAGSWWLRADYSDGIPGGAVGFVGTTSSISGGAHLRGEVAEGFAHSYFADTTNDLAVAAEAGRINQYTIYGDSPQYTSIVLLGDPEMDIRTKPPLLLNVEHTPVVGESSEIFTATVSIGDTPLENALVCLTDFETVHIAGRTDADGIFSVTVSDVDADSLILTVTGKNTRPYIATIPYITSGAYLLVTGYDIDDTESGNADHVLNPGEEIDLYLTVENAGVTGATDIEITLATSDPAVYISSASYSISSLAPESTTEAHFRLSVDDSVSQGHNIYFTTDIAASEGRWSSERPVITVTKANISVNSYYIEDSSPLGNGNGIAEPGESPLLYLAFENSTSSHIDISDITINSSDHFISIESPRILLENIEPEAILSHIPVALTISPEAEFYSVFTLDFHFTNTNPTYTSTGNDNLSVPLAGTGHIFSGPCDYGYYSYDDTDTETGRAPSFSWFDISTEDNVIDGITDEDDRTTTLSSPMDVLYYGESYNRISISTNGFAAFGEQDWSGGSGPGDGHERPIPSIGEANALLAPFWVDLNPRRTGDIYADYIEDEHVIVITWEGVDHYSPPGLYETFQIVLRDPAHFPTITGDWEILFQYLDVAEPDNSSIGIESPDETTGIQYSYRGSYPEASNIISAERAILFTTNPPLMEDFIWIYIADSGIADSIVSPDETISMRPVLGNRGNIDASSVTMSLGCDSPEISISEIILTWDRIESGEESIADASFSVDIGHFAEDTTVLLNFTIVAEGGYSRSGVLPLTIKTSMSELAIELQEGWNLLSYPFTNPTPVSSQLPTAIEPVFSYNTDSRGYDAVDTLTSGLGLWVLMPASGDANLYGSEPVTSNTVHLVPGWNLVGFLSSTLPVSILTSHSEVIEPVYEYNGTSYSEAEELAPGIGYWVLVDEYLSVELP